MIQTLLLLIIHSKSQIINICSVPVDGHDTIFNFSGNMDPSQFRNHKIGVFFCEPDLQIIDLVPFAGLAAEMRPRTVPITYIAVFYVLCSPTDKRVFRRPLIIIKSMKYLIPFGIVHIQSYFVVYSVYIINLFTSLSRLSKKVYASF